MKDKLKSLQKATPYIIFAILMIIVISLKTNYYVDEIYSYGLANATGKGIDIEIEYGKTYTPGALAYQEYMQVQDGERFDYASVWKNQTEDVHPPLYYAVLHTICSIMPNTFSNWYAGSINIIFALLVLFVMRKLILLLTENKYIFGILSFSFIFLTGMLHASAYFRMYMMAMLWVTLITYLFARQVEEKHNCKFYGLMYVVTFAGAMTHYYVIIYAALISAVYGIYLLWNKRIKDTVFFCVTMALAAGTSIAVFPAMIKHMFFGYRGSEAIDNLTQHSGYWEALKEFFVILNSQVFGKMLGCIVIGLMITAAVRYAPTYFGISEESEQEHISFGFERKVMIRYLLIFIPCLFYFMLVSKMTFVAADRYIYPIYAVSYAGVMCITYTILKYFLQDRTFMAVSIIMAALLVGGSYANTGWYYLFRDSKKVITEAKEHGSYDCICILDGETYLLYPEFAEYSNYKSITFLTMDQLDADGINQWISTDGIVISFITKIDDSECDKKLQKVMQDTGYMSSTRLQSFGYDATYFLHY